MTKFKVGDITRIKVRKIKKFDPEELHKAYIEKYDVKDVIPKAEEAWIGDLDKIKIRKGRIPGEKLDPEKLKFAETYGLKPTKAEPTILDLTKDEITGLATKIQQDIETKKVAKIRSAFKKIILDKRSTYLEKAPIIKDTLPKTDWARTSPVLTKAILNIRKTTQPKEVLTEAGKARDIQRISAEASAFKIAKQRAETFKAEAAESGYPIERIKELQKKFIKKSKLVKAPVTSETAIELGFPGKGTGYDPFGIGTANEMLIEFGQRAKGSPKIRHPFAPWEKEKITAWKAIPAVKGKVVKKGRQKGQEVAAVVTKVKGQKGPGGIVKFITPMGPGAEGVIGGKASRIVGKGKLLEYSGEIVPAKIYKKRLIEMSKSVPKRTKPEIGYAVTKSEWSRRNKRLESEFLKGLERRKGPFPWE